MRTTTTPVLALGFRPFFLGAGLLALLSMALWTAVYSFGIALPLAGLAPGAWHAHEMLYGYAMAVIAGFLLTAVCTWTGLPTAHGTGLGTLVGLWLAARLLLLGDVRALPFAAVADLLFGIALPVALARPIVRARQWRQLAILSKLVLLASGNALFYAGVFGLFDQGVRWGLYGGLYLVIALILTLGRRLIPIFTERGTGTPLVLRNSRALDLATLLLLLAFWIAEVFVPAPRTAAACAGGIFAVNAARLALWYTPGILRFPLLWSLHLSFALLALGFLLRALAAVLPVSPLLALHLMAIGGIALVTLAMMTRVALGHTGRSVHEPPAIVRTLFALIVLCAALRVGGPLLAPAYYAAWVLAAQLAWMLAFALFTLAWWPILTRPRIDG